MARLRIGHLALAVTGSLLAAGCATPSRVARATEGDAAPVAIAVAAPRGTGFAELPRRPGERVARNPEPEPTKPVAAAKPPDAPVSVAVAPPPPEAPLTAAVRAYLDNRPEAAAASLKGLDAPNQALMAQLLPPVVALSRVNLGRAGPAEVALLVGQIEAPLKGLSAKALTVAKATFCSDPGGFGHYTPLPEGHVYRPGDLAEVYVELRNVPSVLVQTPGDELYLTHLNRTLRLRDAAGDVVPLTDEERRPAAALESVQKRYSRSPVRDYANTFRVLVPRKPGRYTLTAEYSDPDPKSWRGVSRGMSFTVGGS